MNIALTLPPGPTPLAGVYIINGIPVGTIRLRVSAPGYTPVERDVTFTFAGGPAAVDVQMQRQ